MVKKQEGKLAAENNVDLFTTVWSPDNSESVKGKIIALHGFAEHCGRYDSLYSAVADAGYEVMMFDQRGAGKSVKNRAFGVSNEYYVFKDLDLVFDQFVVEPGYTGFLALWGTSMGGAIALNYGVKGKYRERVSTYLASGPYIDVHKDSQPAGHAILIKVMGVAARVAPRVNWISTPLKPEYFSHDSAYVRTYAKDPLIVQYLSPEFGRDMVQRGWRLKNQMFVEKFVERPVAVFMGNEDHIVDPVATKKMYSLLKVADKHMFEYDGAYHELHNEIPQFRDRYLRDALAWLDSHGA